MSRRDFSKNVKVSQLLAPLVHTTSPGTELSIDNQGFGSSMFMANVGITGDTLSGSVFVEMVIEHSDDDVSFDEVAATDLAGGAGAGPLVALIDDNSEDEAVFKVGYIGDKRYVRMIAALTGTHTNGIPIGIVAVQGHAEAQPQT